MGESPNNIGQTTDNPSEAPVKQPGGPAPAKAPVQAQAKPDTGKPQPGKSMLEGSVDQVREQTAADEGGDKTQAAAWPDDWREQMAGTDDKLRKLLGRYASPNAVAGALSSLRTRLDTGEFKKGLAEDATEDEIAQFRKDNNIPDKPDGYEMPKGLNIPEIDKPIIDKMLPFFHAKNYTPSQVQDVVSQFYAARDEENAQMSENDQAFRAEQEDLLHAEWGPEFRGNINGLRGFMNNTYGERLAGYLMGARLGDGSLAGNNAEFLKAMVGLMKEVNPEATLVRPGVGGSDKAINDRMAEIEKMMATDRDGYHKNENIQAEYRDLIRAKEKLSGRKAA